MTRTTRHISLSVIITAVSVLSACDSKHNGVYGANNWNRNAYANKVLSAPINPMYLAQNGGQVVGYIAQGGVSNTNNPSSRVGGIARGTGSSTGTGGISGGGQQAAGGISGGTPVPASQGTPCNFKLASVSPSAYIRGSTQNFGSTLNETNVPSSGRGIYQIGASYPIVCGPDSEVAATANTFYVTSGSQGQNIFVFRMGMNGGVIGSNAIVSNAPTKIAASATGHVVVLENGGKSMRMFIEGPRIGGDGSYLPTEIANMPVTNNQTIKDVVIDPNQGALYIASEIPGRGRSIKIYGLQAAFQGIFQSYFDSQNAFGPQMYPQFRNIAYNVDETVTQDLLNNGPAPVKIKNFDGLTGVLLNTGKPFFIETQLSKPAGEIASAAPTDQADAQQYYQNVAEDGIVTSIYSYDPYMIAGHYGSTYSQNGFRFVDIAVGDNFMYGLSSGSVYACYVSKDYPWDCQTPRQIGVSYLGQLHSIEMSSDQQYAIVTGSTGLSIGNRVGNFLTFSTIGSPDIVESGGVIHAAALAKITGNLTPVPTPNQVVTNTSPLIQR